MINEADEKLTIIMQGKIPEKIDTERFVDENERQLAVKLNLFIDFMQEIHDFILPLSKGELNNINIPPKNFMASPFKELHSRLLHLTWQAEQVAKGDYSQRVDFMGEFSEAFNSMVVSLDNHEKLLKSKIEQLEEAASHIEKLEKFLPICSSCKKVRLKDADPRKQENWMEIENYISEKTDTMFSHSICPECMKKLYPEFTDE